MSDRPQTSPAAPGPEPVDELRPPASEVGVLGWLNHNLFSSKLNGILTIVMVLLVAALVYGLGTWILFRASWEVITDNMRLFLVGRYPPEEIWRVWLRLDVVVARHLPRVWHATHLFDVVPFALGPLVDENLGKDPVSDQVLPIGIQSVQGRFQRTHQRSMAIKTAHTRDRS